MTFMTSTNIKPAKITFMKQGPQTVEIRNMGVDSERHSLYVYFSHINSEGVRCKDESTSFTITDIETDRMHKAGNDKLEALARAAGATKETKAFLKIVEANEDDLAPRQAALDNLKQALSGKLITGIVEYAMRDRQPYVDGDPDFVNINKFKSASKGDIMNREFDGDDAIGKRKRANLRTA
jgi:hypothetical protein